MAAPGPHLASQPNTPQQPGRPWLLASGSLSLFLNFPALAIRAGFPVPATTTLPARCSAFQPPRKRPRQTPHPALGHLERAASRSDRRPAKPETPASGEELPQPPTGRLARGARAVRRTLAHSREELAGAGAGGGRLRADFLEKNSSATRVLGVPGTTASAREEQ